MDVNAEKGNSSDKEKQTDEKKVVREEFSDDELHPEISKQERRRRRIKVRKRVRVKKKSGPRKRATKMLEIFIWILVITGFIITLFMLISESDIQSKKMEKKKVSELHFPSRNMLFTVVALC